MKGRCQLLPASPLAAGFTLIEVVVALTILSLIMLATITGLRTLANTQGSLERMTARIDEVRTVSSFIRDAMETAAVGGGGGGGGGGGLSLGGSGSRESAFFQINGDSLAWKASVLFGEGFGGAYLVRVAREDDLLMLRWLEPTLTGLPEEWAEAPGRPLVLGLQEFDIAWRGDYADEWQQEWERGDKVGWVRLNIKADGRYWPELIMQVPR
jgi:general secretion pathway protein J